MARTLKRKIADWYMASLANRIGAILFSLTCGFFLLTGAGNFIYLFQRVYQDAATDLERQVRDLANDLTRELNGIADHCEMLARNPAVTAGVLDARNQETHLFALLQRSQRRDQLPRNICITDHRGYSIACLFSPRTDYSAQPWLQEAMASNTHRVAVSTRQPDLPLLYLATPIIQEGTGKAAGAIVAEFDLAILISRLIGPAQHYDHIHLMGRSGDIFQTGTHNTTIHRGVDLELNQPLDTLQLRFGVGIDHTSFHAPLYRLTAAYSLIVLLLAALAFLIVRRIVPPLTARLAELTATADHVASGGELRFDASQAGTDEIGHLARAFATMTRRLREQNESLDQQVRMRTAQLEQQEAYSKALFAHSYIPLVVIDPATGTFIDCNDAAVAIYHFNSRLDVLGKSPADVSAATQYDGSPSAAAVAGHLAAAHAQGFHTFEWRHQRPNGEIWDAEVRLMCFQHAGSELMQFSLRDITEQKKTQAEIWHQANFDALTGLANRGLCLDRLDRALAHARRNSLKVGALFIDLDGFKNINDTLGHSVGDELLVQVAGRLENCVREQDTTCRFGGDEFVFIVPDIEDRSDLMRIATETVAVLHQPFMLAGETWQISGSVGIAVFPDDANTADALLERADQALYRSKHAGKNCFTFYSEPAAA